MKATLTQRSHGVVHLKAIGEGDVFAGMREIETLGADQGDILLVSTSYETIAAEVVATYSNGLDVRMRSTLDDESSVVTVETAPKSNGRP